MQVPLETDKPNPQQGRNTKISNKSKSPELHCKNFVLWQTLGILAPMTFFAEISFCKNPQLFFQNVLMILQINLKLVIFGSSSQIEKLSKWRRICDLFLFPLECDSLPSSLFICVIYFTLFATTNVNRRGQ